MLRGDADKVTNGAAEGVVFGLTDDSQIPSFVSHAMTGVKPEFRSAVGGQWRV